MVGFIDHRHIRGPGRPESLTAKKPDSRVAMVPIRRQRTLVSVELVFIRKPLPWWEGQGEGVIKCLESNHFSPPPSLPHRGGGEIKVLSGWTRATLKDCLTPPSLDGTGWGRVREWVHNTLTQPPPSRGRSVSELFDILAEDRNLRIVGAAFSRE